MASKYQLYNKNGAQMCHHVGCRKHKRLHYAHGGLFCFKHVNELHSIRDLLVQSKTDKNVYMQIVYRQEELKFRKFFHNGHCKYLLELLDNNQSIQI